MQKRNSSKLQPGCIGRVVKLFDMDGGTAGNKLLMDKPYIDGYTLRNCPVDLLMSSEEDDLCWEASGKTPMKMHLEYELAKEDQSSYTSPNLVARLMGLDTVPKRQVDTSSSKRTQDCQSTMLSAKETLPKLAHESELFRNTMPCEVEQHLKEVISDTYRGQSGSKSDEDDHVEAFARQACIETRHLTSGESLASPEESEGEVEILKSNKDLFLEFLRRPNSSFSQPLNEMSALPTSGLTRITVLKPTKTADTNCFPGMKTEKWVSKPTQASPGNVWNKTNFGKACDEPQPTRIVVLKPRIEKSSHTGNEFLSPSTSLSTPTGENLFMEEIEADAQRFRGTAKEITNFIRKSFGSLQTNDPCSSPELSSGYNGDESSPDKSEKEYATGSDSEAMSPTSRFSWTHVNQFASFLSSVSHEPRAQDSFIGSEAKKRLSRRWSSTGVNSNSKLQTHARSLSSNTLGEMLALSKIRKPIRSPDYNGEEPIGSSACPSQNLKEDTSPRNLMRSNSVPLSVGGNYEYVNVEKSHPDVPKSPDQKQHLKTNSLKSLVTNLFFSRNKKSRKESFTAGLVKDGSSATSILIQESQSGKMAGGGTSSHENIMDSQDQPSPISVLETLFADDESRSADSSGILYTDHPVSKASVSNTNPPTLGKSPRIESVARTLWSSSCSDTASACPFNLSLVCNGPQEEQDWCILVPALVSTLGLTNDISSDACKDRWHALQTPLDPSLREKYSNAANHDMNESKRRRWRSNMKLIFDSVNQALLDIAQLNSETKSCRHSDTVLRPILLDQVWDAMSQWISDKAIRLSSIDGEDINHNMMVERVAKREVAGKRWEDFTSLEIDMVGNDIEQKLLDDLLEEAIVQLTANRYGRN